MTLEVRVCVDNAVGSGVVTSRVHGIRASLVEGGLVRGLATAQWQSQTAEWGIAITYGEPHIARGEASNLDHCGGFQRQRE